jgi:hypothetical protein
VSTGNSIWDANVIVLVLTKTVLMEEGF